MLAICSRKRGREQSQKREGGESSGGDRETLIGFVWEEDFYPKGERHHVLRNF